MRTQPIKINRAAAAILVFACLSGCEPIQDPWITGDNYFEEDRKRTPEQQKALRERALNQAGPAAGAGDAKDHETSRFIEK